MNIENKIPEQIINVNNEVQPTPVNVEVKSSPVNTIEVHTPKLVKSKETQRVLRDGAYNIQGTLSEIEHEYEGDE